jgi:hypothetical protein
MDGGVVASPQARWPRGQDRGSPVTQSERCGSLLASTESCSAKRWPPRAAFVFTKACGLGLEVMVSKRRGSFYKSGPSRNWLKTKNPDFVRT